MSNSSEQGRPHQVDHESIEHVESLSAVLDDEQAKKSIAQDAIARDLADGELDAAQDTADVWQSAGQNASNEQTPLLGHGNETGAPDMDPKSEDAVLRGEVKASWQRECKILAKYALPLILSFLLQNSLTLTSIFTVGHIGKNELGAVSLGSMTASITGFAVYQGLVTSLDTLCAQAYGSGHKKLVGLNMQRMIFFLWTCTIPIATFWFFADKVLLAIVPEREIALLAGQYLKVLILGAPAYAAFESGKRFVQAQGVFTATTSVLIVVAPINVLMQWLFVWHFDWGFIGCPIAVVISTNLLVLLLLLYVRFVIGLECWPGFTRKAFMNWGPMVRLALPGFAMVMAEFCAFELLTLAAARMGATNLAANTVLLSLGVLMYNVPFSLSIAGSTRVANLIGASLPQAAKVTTKIIFIFGTLIGFVNMVLLSSLRFQIPRLYTQEEEVIALAAAVLPITAAFQLFDALAAQCNGVLRGLGKQSIGGIVCVLAFYVIGLPVSFGTGFGLHWNLYGLWAGPAIALAVQAGLEGLFIKRTSWEKASEAAAARNAAG